MPEDKNGEQSKINPLLSFFFDKKFLAEWQIPGDIQLRQFEGALAEYFKDNPETQHPFGVPSPELQIIDLTGRIINEGDFLGILLVQDEARNRFIMELPKNYSTAADQVTSDYTHLPTLKHGVPKNAPLHIPEVYGELIHIQPWGRKDEHTVPTFFMEFMDRYQEVSCASHPPDQESLFVINSIHPDIFINADGTIIDIDNEKLKNDAAHDIARNQTLVYFALNGKTQKEFMINAGDYMARSNEQGELEWALITLRGGITEQLDFSDFVYQLLTHTEEGFDTRIGRQEREIHPFADNPQQALLGIHEALQYYPDKLPDQLFLNTLKEIQADPETYPLEGPYAKIPGAIEEFIDHPPN